MVERQLTTLSIDHAQTSANPQTTISTAALSGATSCWAAVCDARRRLSECEAAEGKASIDGRRPSPELLEAFAAARAEVDRLAAAKAIPAKAPLGEVRPDAVRLAPALHQVSVEVPNAGLP